MPVSEICELVEQQKLSPLQKPSVELKLVEVEKYQIKDIRIDAVDIEELSSKVNIDLSLGTLNLPAVEIAEETMVSVKLVTKQPKKRGLQPLRARKAPRFEYKILDKPLIDI